MVVQSSLCHSLLAENKYAAYNAVAYDDKDDSCKFSFIFFLFLVWGMQRRERWEVLFVMPLRCMKIPDT